MNSLTEHELPGEHILRDQLMGMLSDHDLDYKLPGHNPTLGGLCEEMGQVEQIYTHAFKTFKMDWGYRASKPRAPISVASFKAWYAELDAEMYTALNSFSEDDLQTKQVDRGHGFTPSLAVQFMVYHEALLIFYAKASVFLKAIEIPLPDDWRIGIG